LEVLVARDLAVECNGKSIVTYARLSLSKGDIAILIGPNGSGKSSLLNALAGHPRYKVVRGRVLLYGRDITGLPPYERFRLGLGIAVQNPPRLKGVKLRTILEAIVRRRGGEVSEVQRIAKALSIEHLLDRDFGVGFSGGEMKRAEIAMLLAQRPRVALVDEPDSGVDVDSVMIIASALDELMKSATDALLIVTHSGMIAKHIRATKVYVMMNGRVVLESPKFEVLSEVLSKGFKWIMEGGGSGR